MAKGLGSLIRLKKWRVDEKRRALAERLRIEEALERGSRTLEAELVNEQRIATQSPDEAALLFGLYVQGVQIRRRELAASIAKSEVQSAKAREAVQAAHRDLKTFETAEASRQRRDAEELARKEQMDLDEIGLQAHRRRRAEM